MTTCMQNHILTLRSASLVPSRDHEGNQITATPARTRVLDQALSVALASGAAVAHAEVIAVRGMDVVCAGDDSSQTESLPPAGEPVWSRSKEPSTGK